jgi:hypothetical protein
MSETPARCLLRSCDRSEATVAFADATAARQSAPPWRTCYREALAVARRQRARSLELRAATSLAHLWCDQGKRSKHAIFSLQSMAGSLKASTRSI